MLILWRIYTHLAAQYPHWTHQSRSFSMSTIRGLLISQRVCSICFRFRISGQNWSCDSSIFTCLLAHHPSPLSRHRSANFVNSRDDFQKLIPEVMKWISWAHRGTILYHPILPTSHCILLCNQEKMIVAEEIYLLTLNSHHLFLPKNNIYEPKTVSYMAAYKTFDLLLNLIAASPINSITEV